MASPSPPSPQRLSASTLAAYRALRRSLRASDIEDRGLVSALSAEFRRLLLRGDEEEENTKKRKTGTAAAGPSTTAASTTAASTSAAAALARDFAFLLSAVKHQRELLLSYDIGIDRETRQMETVRRTAARVGLRLPGEAREGEKEEEEEGRR